MVPLPETSSGRIEKAFETKSNCAYSGAKGKLNRGA
jgi:hypothetical protein